jgi:hypothetical protein
MVYGVVAGNNGARMAGGSSWHRFGQLQNLGFQFQAYIWASFFLITAVFIALEEKSTETQNCSVY